jgi:glucose-1-phosphate adenylyltransferase
MKSKVICIIMGGGRGTRLFPLTQQRCKPAVPLAGRYRLVDIPISNCINSGLNQIFILTQFNTASLHRHIQESYKFDPFGGGFVDILAAEQTDKGDTWYQGTADAVRQNLHHFDAGENDLFLILSGDQLYRMDLSDVIRQHRQLGSEVTIAARAMQTDTVEGLGLMRVDDNMNITQFVEKPKDPSVIQSLCISEQFKMKAGQSLKGDYVLANMGIYVFNQRALYNALDNNFKDFGREVIPGMLKGYRMNSYVFDGYWEDIGTVKAFFETNLSLTDPVPPFNFFDELYPVYTRVRYLPASKINNCKMNRVIIAGGCQVDETRLERCVIGVRSKIGEGSHMENVVMMGADKFETPEQIRLNRDLHRPDIGIGSNCEIINSIVDKNARIGNNVKLNPAGKAEGPYLGDNIYVRDGVLIVNKGGIVPDNTVV